MLISMSYMCLHPIIISRYRKFTHIFVSILDSVAPLKEIIKQDSESWYNSDIHELIKKRNYYLISFRKTKSTEDYNKYIDFRNQVSYKIKKTKINFYKEMVNNVKSNTQKTLENYKGIRFK